jgi:hypothetical protein
MEWVKGMGKGEWVKGMDSALRLSWVVWPGSGGPGGPPPRVFVELYGPATEPGSRPASVNLR